LFQSLQVSLLTKYQILRIILYILHDFESAEIFYDASQEYNQYSSIRKYYEKLYLEKLIERKIVNRRNQLFITSTYIFILRDKNLTVEQFRLRAICKIKFKR